MKAWMLHSLSYPPFVRRILFRGHAKCELIRRQQTLLKGRFLAICGLGFDPQSKQNHKGMFPCRFFGRSTFLVFSIRKARIT
jgi:hypothetical protein